jgi:hypothetical protein
MGIKWGITEMLGTLATFMIGMLIVCSLILLTAWTGDAVKYALEPMRAAHCSEGLRVGQGRVKSRTPITSLYRGGPVNQPHEPAIIDLAVISLHDAIRRVAARILEAPGTLEVAHFSRLERLMRIAVALAGSGSGMPLVQFHGVPPVAGPPARQETLSVNLSDLLAARASDHLGAALEGDPQALRGFEQEAERLLETEDIQLLD